MKQLLVHLAELAPSFRSPPGKLASHLNTLEVDALKSVGEFRGSLYYQKDVDLTGPRRYFAQP